MKVFKGIISGLGIALLIGFFLFPSKSPKEYATQDATIRFVQPSLESTLLTGFRQGEVSILYPYFDELITICLNDTEEIYLAYNAKAALQSFFLAHPPANFQFNHKGTSKGGKEHYFIGDYTATTNEVFRIYIFTENDLISEIEISEKEVAS